MLLKTKTSRDLEGFSLTIQWLFNFIKQYRKKPSAYYRHNIPDNQTRNKVADSKKIRSERNARVQRISHK